MKQLMQESVEDFTGEVSILSDMTREEAETLNAVSSVGQR